MNTVRESQKLGWWPIFYASALLLVAWLLLSAPAVNAACVGGSCGTGVSLTPDSGKVGTMVVLSISGDVLSEGDYEVRWSPTAAFEPDRTKVLVRGKVSKEDTSIAITFTIPEAEYGANYIQFKQLRRVATFQFTVKSSLKFNPASALPGSTVTIVGQGFPAESGGRLIFDGKPTNVTFICNQIGSFSAKFIVPASAAGRHELTANCESSAVTVIGTLEVVPQEMPPNSSGNSSLDESNIQQHNSTYNIPVSLADTKSPPRPGPLTPMGHRFGLVGNQTISFVWSEVSDPSGVTYTLEVADNHDFAPSRPTIQKAGLTGSSCILDIPPGAYYWRIKAIDGASNESEWSYAPNTFVVAEVSNFMHEAMELLKKSKVFTILGFIIGGFILLRIIVLLIRAWLQRRRRYYY